MKWGKDVDACCEAVKNGEGDEGSLVAVLVEQDKMAREQIENAANNSRNKRRDGPN